MTTAVKDLGAFLVGDLGKNFLFDGCVGDFEFFISGTRQKLSLYSASPSEEDITYLL